MTSRGAIKNNLSFDRNSGSQSRMSANLYVATGWFFKWKVLEFFKYFLILLQELFIEVYVTCCFYKNVCSIGLSFILLPFRIFHWFFALFAILKSKIKTKKKYVRKECLILGSVWKIPVHYSSRFILAKRDWRLGWTHWTSFAFASELFSI